MVPAVLKPGDVLRVGEAVVKHEGDVVEASDRYGVHRTAVWGREVKVYPVQPLNRPRRLTNCLVVELEEPLLVSSRVARFWVRAPVELAVASDGVTLAVVSPVKVKHSLYGEVFDGVVCRYYKSRACREPPEPKPGEALVKVVVNVAGSASLSHLVFYVDSVDLYYSSDGVLFYEELEVSGSPPLLTVKASGRPPLPHLSRVRELRPPRGFRRSFTLKVG